MSETIPCSLQRILLPALPSETPKAKASLLKGALSGLVKEPTVVTPNPRKIKRNIGIAKNYVLVCRQQRIYYTSIKAIKDQTPRSAFQPSQFFQIEEGSNLLEILDIGNSETAIIMSDAQQQLSFYQFKRIHKTD